MDNRKWNTERIYEEGILNLPIPDTSHPDINYAEINDYDHGIGDIEEILEKEGAITASQYYGCWYVWKTEKGYSGELLQYRAVTESFTDIPYGEALDKVEEWFEACQG